jgi:outer membrane biogenesis lipoprotein LolB
MMRRLAVVLAMAAASCASVPEQKQALPALSAVPASFEVSGRLAIRQDQRSDIARLRWTRTRGADEWVILSPVGSEVARIESNARGATLTRAGAPDESAESFEALTERILGVGLDPQTLASWLHGGATPAAPGDWKVTIDETQRAGSVDLAKRITASRGDVVVKLAIDEYRVLGD